MMPVTLLSNRELLEFFHALFGKLPEPQVTRTNTALLVIDVQYVDAHPDHGLGAKAKRLNMADALTYYWERVQSTVLPNIRALLAAARDRKLEIIHVRVASLTADGRDSSRRYKNMGMRTPRDTKEAQFLPEVAPQGDELVLSKVTSSAFNSTTIDRILRNLGIQTLILTGVVTNGCIESTARSAAELDYGVIVVEDAVAAMAPQLHEHSILNMGHKDAVIKSTSEVLTLIAGAT
jgi:nicotinamidase-related amidase